MHCSLLSVPLPLAPPAAGRLLIHAPPVSYPNNQHDNRFVFYRTDDSIIAYPVFPKPFEVLSQRISKAAGVIVRRYLFP
jgi:hypothetical protein